MPLAQYALAGLYALFGASMETSRLAFAALHGATAAGAFAVARRLGVRPELAVLAGLAHAAVSAPAWPYASPHWVAALLLLGVLASAVGRLGSPRSPLVTGLLTGALFCVQHQNAVPVALAVCALFALDHAADRRCGRVGAAPARRVALFAAGAAAWVVPFLLVHVALAGPGPVASQILVEPWTQYRVVNRASWGSTAVRGDLAERTFVPLLRLLPLLLLAALARGALAWRHRDRDALDRLALLATLCAGSAASIAYYPDFIHIAFVAGPFWVLAAESLEAASRRLAALRSGLARAPGLALALGLAAGLAAHLGRNAQRLAEAFPVSIETGFGRVDVESAAEASFLLELREILATAGATELLAYPSFISLYLVTGTHNPTGHDYNFPGEKSPEQLLEVRDALARAELPFVFLMPPQTPRGDPVRRYVEARYECAPTRVQWGGRGRTRCLLYRLRDIGAADPASRPEAGAQRGTAERSRKRPASRPEAGAQRGIAEMG